MDIDKRMILGLQVWWLTFGMDKVHSDNLMDIDAIHGGFVWADAVEDGILSKATYNKYALTQKALDLIKEYQHEH